MQNGNLLSEESFEENSIMSYLPTDQEMANKFIKDLAGYSHSTTMDLYSKPLIQQAKNSFISDSIDKIKQLVQTYLPAETSANTQMQIKGGLKFLAILAIVEREAQKIKKENFFRNILREFLINHFKLDKANFHSYKPRNIIYYLMNQCQNLLDLFMVNMENITPMSYKKNFKGFMEKSKFKFSRKINNKKANENRVTTNIWFGKIPANPDIFKNTIHDEDNNNTETKIQFGTCKPSLIISAVNQKEFLEAKKEIIIPAYFVLHDIKQICLPLFIDFGRPYRNDPDFHKRKHPLSGEPLDTEEKWNCYLDELYTEISKAHTLMEETIDADGDVYVHCKAGKGRSVMVVGSYLARHPDHLKKTIASWQNKKVDTIKIPDDIGTLVEFVWEHMLKQRNHIDQDEKSKRAVIDCVTYIHDQKQKEQEEQEKHLCSLLSSSPTLLSPSNSASSISLPEITAQGHHQHGLLKPPNKKNTAHREKNSKEQLEQQPNVTTKKNA